MYAQRLEMRVGNGGAAGGLPSSASDAPKRKVRKMGRTDSFVGRGGKVLHSPLRQNNSAASVDSNAEHSQSSEEEHAPHKMGLLHGVLIPTCENMCVRLFRHERQTTCAAFGANKTDPRAPRPQRALLWSAGGVF